MFPLILLGAASTATTSTLTVFGYIAAGTGLGSLTTFIVTQILQRETSDKDESDSDDETIPQALDTIEKEQKALSPAFNKLEQDAIKTLESTVQASHATRLKLSALTQAFNAQNEEMQKTTRHMSMLVSQLIQTQQTSEHTILELTNEIARLRENISASSQSLQQTMARLSDKETALDNVVQQLNTAQATWENNHLQYQAKITALTDSLDKAQQALHAKARRETNQTADIQRLQATIEKLTECLKKTTAAGETYTHQYGNPNMHTQAKSDKGTAANLNFF